MKRPLLLMAGVVVLGAAAFFVWYQPAPRPAAVPPPPPKPAPPPAPPDLGPLPRPIAAPEPTAPRVAEAPVDADAGAAPDAAKADEGPYTVDLGTHDLLLRERDGRFLRVGVQLTTPSRTTRAEMARRREALLRMLYYLGTHRAASALEQPDAEARFAHDLRQRLQQTVKTGAISRIDLEPFEMIEKPLPDAYR